MPSLRCLISALTQAGRGGLVFRFSCPVLLLGGRALQEDITVCGEHSQCSGHTGFAPAHTGFAPSTLLRLQAALQGAGPELPAVPVFRFSTKARIRLSLRFVLSPAEQLRQPGACQAHSPWVRAPSRLRGPSLGFRAHWSGAPCDSSGELVSSCDPPGGCQPSRISRSLWLETGSLFAVW